MKYRDNRICGWIKSEKQKYVTACGRVTKLHRGFIYCPYCGKYIHIVR